MADGVSEDRHNHRREAEHSCDCFAGRDGLGLGHRVAVGGRLEVDSRGLWSLANDVNRNQEADTVNPADRVLGVDHWDIENHRTFVILAEDCHNVCHLAQGCGRRTHRGVVVMTGVSQVDLHRILGLVAAGGHCQEALLVACSVGSEAQAEQDAWLLLQRTGAKRKVRRMGQSHCTALVVCWVCHEQSFS